MIAADLRLGDRFRSEGANAPLYTAHSPPRADGVNPALVHVRISVEGVDNGAPYDATFIADARLIRAEETAT